MCVTFVVHHVYSLNVWIHLSSSLKNIQLGFWLGFMKSTDRFWRRIWYFYNIESSNPWIWYISLNNTFQFFDYILLHITQWIYSWVSDTFFLSYDTFKLLFKAFHLVFFMPVYISTITNDFCMLPLCLETLLNSWSL